MRVLFVSLIVCFMLLPMAMLRAHGGHGGEQGHYHNEAKVKAPGKATEHPFDIKESSVSKRIQSKKGSTPPTKIKEKIHHEEHNDCVDYEKNQGLLWFIVTAVIVMMVVVLKRPTREL